MVYEKTDFNSNNNDIGKKINDIHENLKFDSPIYQMKAPEIHRNPTYDLIENQKEANLLLSKIVENTSVLKDLVAINRETQLNTEELNYVMRAIYDVAKAKDSNEAKNLYAKAIKIINDAGDTASNVVNLTTLLTGIYSTLISFLDLA